MDLRAALISTSVCSAPNNVTLGLKLFPPDVAKAIYDRFRFVEGPKVVADFATGEGLKFQYGFDGGLVINSMTVFNDGIYCQSIANTDQIDDTIRNVISLLRSEFGILIDNENLSWFHNSQVEVALKSGFADLMSRVAPFAATLEAKIRSHGIHVGDYGASGLIFAGEGQGIVKPGRFVLERRLQTPMSENVFFSEAPVSTQDHLALLSEIEASF
jgi:hypothetical protein